MEYLRADVNRFSSRSSCISFQGVSRIQGWGSQRPNQVVFSLVFVCGKQRCPSGHQLLLAWRSAINIVTINSTWQNTWPSTCNRPGAWPTWRREARLGFRLTPRTCSSFSLRQQLSLTEIWACNYCCDDYFNTNQQRIKILPCGCYLASARLQMEGRGCHPCVPGWCSGNLGEGPSTTARPPASTVPTSTVISMPTLSLETVSHGVRFTWQFDVGWPTHCGASVVPSVQWANSATLLQSHAEDFLTSVALLKHCVQHQHVIWYKGSPATQPEVQIPSLLSVTRGNSLLPLCPRFVICERE